MALDKLLRYMRRTQEVSLAKTGRTNWEPQLMVTVRHTEVLKILHVEKGRNKVRVEGCEAEEGLICCQPGSKWASAGFPPHQLGPPGLVG